MTITIGAIFLSILLFVLIISTVLYNRFFSNERKLAKRVDKFTQSETKEIVEQIPFILKDEQLSDIPLLNRILERLNITKNLKKLLEQADSQTKVGNFIVMNIFFFIGAFLISLIFKNIVIKVALILLISAIPIFNLRMKRNKRLKAFIRQFPDALDMMTSAIKAGHAFNQSMQLIGQEAPDPVGIEFKRAFEQYNLGLNIRDVLLEMIGRVDSLDLKLFITAILLQRETGGNLTEILEKISYTIRERFKLIGQIQTYTAQGRMSALILGTLPIAFVLIISVMNPQYLRPLFQEKLGHYLIIIAATMQILGFLWIKSIVKIRYQ